MNIMNNSTALPCLYTTPMDLATAKAKFDTGDYNHHWKKTPRKKIQGSVNKIVKVYRAVDLATSEDLILCDPAQPKRIYAEAKRTGRIPKGCGFKSMNSVKNWASQASSFFEVASGLRDAKISFATWDDDWAALIDHLAGSNGGPVLWNARDVIKIRVLARECRLRGLSLSRLTGAQIDSFARDLPSAQKEAIKRGAKQLDTLRADDRVPDSMLPAAPIGKLAPLTSPLQRTPPPLHPELESTLTTWIDRLMRGEETLEYGETRRTIETDGISEDHAKNISVGVRWYWQGALQLGVVSHDAQFDIEAFTRPEVLADIVEFCADGGFGSICRPDTRRKYAQSAIMFLTHLCPDYKATLNPKLFDAKTLRKRVEEESVNAAFKRETCLRFISDEDFQRNFFSMPRIFFEEAKSLISRFDTLKNSDEPGLNKTQHRALDLAIMAAHTAIATRYPLRLATRQQLLTGGSTPHVIFPDSRNQEDAVSLLVPGYIVKNGYFSGGVPLLNTRSINPHEILDWYLKNAHPLILKYKSPDRKFRRPNALFCGLHIETLRRIWRNYIAELGLYITPHMCRHIVASHLYANGVPICQIAELLGDSEETTRKSYAFIDKSKMIRDVMETQAALFRRLRV